jgi:hypothetical protein
VQFDKAFLWKNHYILKVPDVDKRRTNPFFLSDGEEERERKRTQNFVKSLAKNPLHLCDACGNHGGNDKWHCKKCNAYFCYQCGKDFARFQNKSIPDCPICTIKMQPQRDMALISDEQKIIRYVTTTHVREINNKRDLFDRLAKLFNRDIIYIESVWSNLEQQNPKLIGQITSKFKNEVLKQHYQRLQFEALHPEAKNENIVLPESPVSIDKKKVDIKDIKPIDGIETEWKQGKMSPTDQKTYRSKFDEQ